MDVVWQHGSVTVADTRRDDTMFDMARRLLDSAPERFVLLGTSMGGYVALAVMALEPERVSGLALVSTSARPDSAEKAAERMRQSAIVENGGFDELVDAAFPGVVSPRNSDDEQLLGEWRAMANATGPAAFLRQHQAIIARGDSRPLLPTIECPTAVLHGSEDLLIPLEVAREMADAVPGAELTVIDGAGHFVFHEQPAAAASAVRALLDRAA